MYRVKLGPYPVRLVPRPAAGNSQMEQQLKQINATCFQYVGNYLICVYVETASGLSPDVVNAFKTSLGGLKFTHNQHKLSSVQFLDPKLPVEK